MQVYSKNIIRFIATIKRAVKEIIAKEVGLRVFGDRFYDKRERISYPIKIVIFNNKSMLGYFAGDFYELGFHEKLMHAPKEQLLDIIRHEIAHYITFIEHPVAASPHGDEFRATCRRFGWGDAVWRATTCLDDGQTVSESAENAVLRKVQKLMALASSQNPHEAELAMIKSQELLLKHNLDVNEVESDDEKVFLIRILKQKKENAKMRAIAQILSTFFVSSVFSRCSGWVYLELVGNKTNLEIAEYVAHFLDNELDHHWLQAKKTSKLQGQVAKNSFLLGIAKGYCNKIAALKHSYSKEVSNALISLENRLVEVQAMCYPRLRYTRSSASHCSHSSALGELVGNKLTIKPGLTSTPPTIALLN